MAIIKRNQAQGSFLPDFFDNSFWGGSSLFQKMDMPAVNIKETENAIKIEVAAPGIPKDKLHVNLENRTLIIEGENQYEDETKDAQYTRKEFGRTSFQRRFALPDHVNPEMIEARCHDGILDITLPKTEESRLKMKKEIKVL